MVQKNSLKRKWIYKIGVHFASLNKYNSFAFGQSDKKNGLYVTQAKILKTDVQNLPSKTSHRVKGILIFRKIL